MIKREIKYKDFDGKEVTETARFNLTKAELMRMTADNDLELETRLRDAAETKDAHQIFAYFEDLIKRSYGVVKDGMFIKDPISTARFMASEAYSELLFSLMSNEEAAAEFTRGILPPTKD